MTFLEQARENRVIAIAAMRARKKLSAEQASEPRFDAFARPKLCPTPFSGIATPSDHLRLAA